MQICGCKIKFFFRNRQTFAQEINDFVSFYNKMRDLCAKLYKKRIFVDEKQPQVVLSASIDGKNMQKVACGTIIPKWACNALVYNVL